MGDKLTSRSRGAAAVEFALIAPVLFVLLLGIFEFGYRMLVESSAAGAAREGARAAAISGARADATTVATNYFKGAINTGTNPLTVTATFRTDAGVISTAAKCPAKSQVIVTVAYKYSTLTRFFGTAMTANGRGEMRCGG